MYEIGDAIVLLIKSFFLSKDKYRIEFWILILFKKHLIIDQIFCLLVIWLTVKLLLYWELKKVIDFMRNCCLFLNWNKIWTKNAYLLPQIF